MSRIGDSVRAAAVVLLASRAAVLVVGYLAILVFGFPGGRPPVRDFDNELLNLPSRFDARWYLQIANEGYSYHPDQGQQNIVFFPALPMTIRATAALAGGGLRASVVAGTVISLAAFLAALAYLHAFTRGVERREPDDSRTTLWLIAFYPFSIFYGAIYTESLFLLAAVGALYHFKRREHMAAACWAVVGGLTRPNGFLLAFPLAIQAVRGGVSVRRLATAAAPVAGAAIFSLFVWSETGDPLMWAKGHAAWGRTYQGLFALAADRYRMIATGGVSGYLAALPHDALNAAAALFTVATAWPVARALGVEYAVWMILTILPPLAAGGFISAGRFSSVLFPSFVWLGSVIPGRHLAAWIGVFAAIQAICAAMFYTWRPIY